MAHVPQLPDSAFDRALQRHKDLHDVTMAGPGGDFHAISDRFHQSLGLGGENDPRAYALARSTLAALSETPVHPHHVHAAVVGITLGLLLAEATDWQPPLAGS
jgi:hypothetical protein